MISSPDRVVHRTLAILTVGVASLALAGCSLLGNITNNNSDGATPSDAPTAGDSTDVFTIAVGDCLNDGGVTGEVSEVLVIDCAQPHDSEAFASIMMTDGDFPGDDAVQQQAADNCTAEFGTFVGTAYDTSTLDFAYYYPTESSWAQGDREILCLLYDPAGKSTGTLAGAAR